MTQKFLFRFGALAFLLGGCIAPPPAPQKPLAVEHEHTYSESFDVIWAKLIRVLPANDINIKTVDKTSGLIYAEAETINPQLGDNTKSRAYIRAVAACKHLDYESNYSNLHHKFNITVSKSGSGTLVTLNIKYDQDVMNDDGQKSGDVPCGTTGVQEQAFFKLLP